jgi:hypothetical protein
MQPHHGDLGGDETVSLSLYLDDAAEPFAVYRPPATVELDTTRLADGPTRCAFKRGMQSATSAYASCPSSCRTAPASR